MMCVVLNDFPAVHHQNRSFTRRIKKSLYGFLEIEQPNLLLAAQLMFFEPASTPWELHHSILWYV